MRTNNTTESINNLTISEAENLIFKFSWIPAQISTVLVFCGSMWAFLSLLKYGFDNNKFKRNAKNIKQANLMILALLTPLITMIRTLSIQGLLIIFYVYEENATTVDHACEVVADLSIFLFLCATWPTYIFLYYRQRMLYKQPSLKHLNNKRVRFFSYLFIFFIICGGSFSTIIYLYPKSYKMSKYGCTKRQQEKENLLPNYLAALITIISQFILFFLFTYPLRKHKRANKKSSCNESSDSKRVIRAMRLSTISMAICVSSDILAIILVAVLVPKDSPRTTISAIYDLSLFVNVISVLFSFDEYKIISKTLCESVRPFIQSQTNETPAEPSQTLSTQL